MNLFYAFAFICCCFIPAKSSATDYLLKGTIGKSPVILHLTVDKQELSGVYFYEKTCVDILLTGTVNGTSFSFKTGTEDVEEQDREHFRLTRSGEQFTGSWTYKGKRLDVALTTVQQAQITHPFQEKQPIIHSPDDFYSQMKIDLARFQRLDSFTVVNGVTFQWFKEAHFDLVMPRIVKGAPMKTITYVNDELEALQLSSFTIHGSCDYADGYQNGITELYIDSHFFAVQTWSVYACDHARPDYALDDYNFDLQNRKPLSADDLLQFDNYVIRTPDNYTEWSAYRDAVFGKKINAYFKLAYSDYYPNGTETQEELDELCNYDDPGLWSYGDLLITSEGFLIGAYYTPRIMKTCDNPEWAIIPFAAFKNDLNPDYRDELIRIR